MSPISTNLLISTNIFSVASPAGNIDQIILGPASSPDANLTKSSTSLALSNFQLGFASALKASTFSAVLFQTTPSCPSLSSFTTIREPIRPRPTNPNFISLLYRNKRGRSLHSEEPCKDRPHASISVTKYVRILDFL